MGKSTRTGVALATSAAACLAWGAVAAPALAAPVSRAKLAERAKNADRVDGYSASRRAHPGRLLALNGRRQFPDGVFSAGIQRALTDTCPPGRAIQGITARGAVSCTVAGLSLPLTVELATTPPLLSLTNLGAGGGLDLTSSSAWATGFFRNRAGGAALRAESAGTGPEGDALAAFNSGDQGFGLKAELRSATNPGAAVYARTAGNGRAIDAEVEDPSAADALYARSLSGNTASHAGVFSGNVEVNANAAQAGDLSVEGDLDVGGTVSANVKAFRINHPLDPGSWLQHSSVESPDMKNVYDGVVRTNARGYATVRLPDWFQALNRDFRYQLTTIRSFARAVVWREVRENRFTIRTSRPRVKVSWQVTGIRHDDWADANRVRVEVKKGR